MQNARSIKFQLSMSTFLAKKDSKYPMRPDLFSKNFTRKKKKTSLTTQSTTYALKEEIFYRLSPQELEPLTFSSGSLPSVSFPTAP